MIKKIIMSLGVVLLLSFTSCGEDNKEAKELLQKILQFVGIPSSIIVQVCQDTNIDGICNLNEAKTKVTINEDDSLDDILEKISLTEDGKYFLETYTPELPILVELQDVAKVDFDDGKFTLAFNGFKTKEDDNETKEISILETMIDAGHLRSQNVEAIRNLDSEYAQDQFYSILLRDLESNINTLRSIGLTSSQSIRGNVQEMAEELLAFGVEDTLPKELNSCKSDDTCIDEVLNRLSIELLINSIEAAEIKKNQESIVTTNDSNQDKIDMANHYAPISSITKEYISFTKIDSQAEQNSQYSENFTVNGNVISQETANGTQTITINKDTVVTTQPDNTAITYSRYSKVGDILYTIPLDSIINDELGGKAVTTGEMVCTLAEKTNEFSNKGYSYTGEILKISCTINSKTDTTTAINSDFISTVTTKGTSIAYTEKDIAMVSAINDSCSEGNFLPKICTHAESYYLK